MGAGKHHPYPSARYRADTNERWRRNEDCMNIGNALIATHLRRIERTARKQMIDDTRVLAEVRRVRLRRRHFPAPGFVIIDPTHDPFVTPRQKSGTQGIMNCNSGRLNLIFTTPTLILHVHRHNRVRIRSERQFQATN